MPSHLDRISWHRCVVLVMRYAVFESPSLLSLRTTIARVAASGNPSGSHGYAIFQGKALHIWRMSRRQHNTALGRTKPTSIPRECQFPQLQINPSYIAYMITCSCCSCRQSLMGQCRTLTSSTAPYGKCSWYGYRRWMRAKSQGKNSPLRLRSKCGLVWIHGPFMTV